MRTFVKTCLCGLVSVLVYTYILLPLTVPKLEIHKEWTKDDLKWETENIFWFIQVTDLHISKYVHKDIKDSLEIFFTRTLDTIQPKVVLASGDLTDAKDKDGVDSFQVEEEWRTYANLLAKHKVQEKTIYLDIRGNHDTFDVHHMQHENNLHRLYSAKGIENPSTYTYTFNFHGTNYSWFALDATMKTGPKKVFNFLGFLEDQDYHKILQEKHSISANKKIYFGHFPSSCVVAPYPGFRSVLEGGLVYLSGHLHTLGGLAPRLYTLHRHGTPELELADFKENRFFRLLAIDNGLLSFSDSKLEEWPLIVITNPKNSQYLAPRVEPVQKIDNSSQIRVLAFSPAGISAVYIGLDGEDEKTGFKHPHVPNLFVLPWKPPLDGQEHNINVRVTDSEGNERNVSQKFTTGFSSSVKIDTQYKLYARLLLMSDIASILEVLWILSILVSTTPILVARYKPSALRHAYSLSISSKMAELAEFSPLFYLYLGMAAWVAFGPWHVGEILSGHTGVILPWGILLRGQLLPSFYPYVASFIHLYLFHTPLFWTLLFKFKWRLESEKSKVRLALSNIPVTLVLSSQAVMLIVLYFFPSKLGIFKEICILIAPVEISMIILGFGCNGLVSYWINQSRKIQQN